MFSGLFGTRQPIGMLFPEEDHLSSSQLSSVACSSVCRVEVSWAFLHSVWLSHWCHPCSAHSHVGKTLWVADITRRHNLKAGSLILWLLESFLIHTYPFCNVL